MQKWLVKIPKYILPVILVIWCAVLLAQKIDLPLADLGRHLKNGAILVHGSWTNKQAVLHTNFYSYTEPGHEFVNHHWLSGVVFYLIFQMAGFGGLSAFYIAVVTAAFFLAYWTAKKRAGSAVAASLAVLILPIIASRTEVRPEGFTYLFMMLFYWILWKSRHHAGSTAGQESGGVYKGLFILPVLMLLWVNLHIGFIFGFLILGAFFLDELIKDLRLKIKDKNYKVLYYRSRLLFIVGVGCALAGLVNPFFIKGLLYPLNIFRQYGYLIVENQSVMFLERLGIGSGLYFGLFKFLLGLAAASFIARFVVAFFPAWTEGNNIAGQPINRRATGQGAEAVNMTGQAKQAWKKFPYHELLLLATTGFLALFAIRNFPVFGLLFLPIVAGNVRTILPKAQHMAYKLLPVAIAFIIVLGGSFRFWESYKYKSATFGLGLMPNAQNAAQFFISQGIKGPIFNNYDIGGYLIYNLYPKEKIFTDNRPEAYSVDHFQKDYIPAQQDPAKFAELEAKHRFNTIFFSHRDLTPWGQAFLVTMVKDPAWAVVYMDSYNIIFLKKNLENVEIIRKFAIPPENFGVVQN